MMSKEQPTSVTEETPTELRPEDKLVAALTPEGMGATEDDADEMFHEGEGDSPEDAKVDNISEGETLTFGSDAPEGQVHAEWQSDDEEDEDDEVKQST